MINLIPNEEKKRMAMDFYRRFTMLFLLMLSCCMLVVLFAILPSYFLSLVKGNFADAKLKTQENEPVPLLDQETQVAIKSLDAKLTLVENAEKNKFSISEKVINEIVLNKMPDIKITRISYESLPAGTKILLNGTAESRERLLLFRQVLEDNAAFKSVDLPISNFIKGKDIQFNLNLVPA